MGTGSGFPLNELGEPQDTAIFNCSMDEDQFVEVWVQDRVGNTERCTTLVLVYDTAGVCPIIPPPPPPSPVTVCARTFGNNQVIQNVTFSSSWTIPGNATSSSQLPVKPGGCAELSTLPPTTSFTLGAAKDVFPLNGVTTYDLVLISKHILDIQPLDASWKIAAADANRSGSVTTFDIVELRKLILGLTVKLPNNTPSWRLFVDTCTASGSPFSGMCPAEYILPVLPLAAYPSQITFKGLKVGDVNGSGTPTDTLQSIAEARGFPVSLELPDLTMQAGELLEIPIRISEGGNWEGIQFSLQFDPGLLELESVCGNETLVLKPENWAIPQPGVLNLSWSEGTPVTILPGDAFMRLKVRAHSNGKLSEIIKLPENAQISPEAYDTEGVSHRLQLVFSQEISSTEQNKVQIFSPMPNPTTGITRLPLRLMTPEMVSLELADLSGKVIVNQSYNLDAGAHMLDIPATIPSGVYVWRVIAGSVSKSGKLVRL